jgi:hypothetical protein
MEPHVIVELSLASGAAWLMMRAGLAKNVLELRRKRRICPSCGRQGSCSCR